MEAVKLEYFSKLSELPSEFFKSEVENDIFYYLKEHADHDSLVSLWIVGKDHKKIIRAARLSEFNYDLKKLVFHSDEDNDLSCFRDSYHVYVYIGGTDRNIIFKVEHELTSTSRVVTNVPTAIFIHELRKEKRLRLPFEDNYLIEFYMKNKDQTFKGACLDVSEKGVGFYFECKDLNIIKNRDLLFINHLPLNGIKYPIEAEVKYVRFARYFSKGKMHLGLRVGCRLKNYSIPNLKKK